MRRLLAQKSKKTGTIKTKDIFYLSEKYVALISVSNRSVLVQLSSWCKISLFSELFAFLEVLWERQPHLSNKTLQHYKIYVR